MTATDLTKAKVVMDTLVTMFAQYCSEPFVVESGEVTTAEGQVLHYPTLNYRKEVVETDKVNKLVGKSTFQSSKGHFLIKNQKLSKFL